MTPPPGSMECPMPGRTRPSLGSQSPVRRVGPPARVALTATVAALALQPFVGQSADAAAAVRPAPAKALPAAVDAVPTYQDQRSCDPAAKPGVEAYARMVLTTYRQGRNGGIVPRCGLRAPPAHKEGGALDWVLGADVPAGEAAR